MQAASKFDIDLIQSFVIGDAVADIEAALAIGAKPILVLTGRGPEARELLAKDHPAYTIAVDLMDAVEWSEREESLAR